MIVNVAIDLESQYERGLFESLVVAIEAHRSLTAAERYEIEQRAADPDVGKSGPQESMRGALGVSTLAAPPMAVEPSETIVVEPKEIPLGQLEAALTAFYKAKGIADAKALLAEFGAARIGDVPAERRAEMLKRMAV